MPVELSQIGKVYGDRAIVRKVGGPEKRGGLFLPKSAADKPKQQEVWFGVVEHLGDGMKYADAFGIKVGDLVGCTDMGSHCETFKGDDGKEHVWVAEEFIVCKDQGKIQAFIENRNWTGAGFGVEPIGGYVLVEADEVQSKKNGVHIPDSLQEKQKTGTVIGVAAGDLVADSLYPVEIEPEWAVLFGQYSGHKIKFWEKEYLLMRKDDIICRMVREPAHV